MKIGAATTRRRQQRHRVAKPQSTVRQPPQPPFARHLLNVVRLAWWTRCDGLMNALHGGANHLWSPFPAMERAHDREHEADGACRLAHLPRHGRADERDHPGARDDQGRATARPIQMRCRCWTTASARPGRSSNSSASPWPARWPRAIATLEEGRAVADQTLRRAEAGPGLERAARGDAAPGGAGDRQFVADRQRMPAARRHG